MRLRSSIFWKAPRFFSWTMPTRVSLSLVKRNKEIKFMDLAEEYQLVREGAGLIDVSQRGKIELVGPDAASFLHNLSTNDIRSLPSGAGCEIFLTNAKGKVLAFGWVYHLPGESEPPTF